MIIGTGTIHNSSDLFILGFIPYNYTLFLVGVSLQLQGQTIPNNSLVNLADLLYRTTAPQLREDPTNSNGLQTLMCVTDFVDCCETPARGYWYYPNGSRIEFTEGNYATFQSNRGQYEIIDGQKFYGSVRIWHRYTPLERGLFRCALPDANHVNHSLYVNICELPMQPDH